MNVNFFGNVNAIQAVLPIMKSQKGGGRVISISSVLGLFGCMGYSAYAPSKAAIISLYETLQQENYPYGISFSVATPASIGTESFYQDEQKIKPPETLELEKDDPILSPEIVAGPIIDSLTNWSFLVSPSGFNSHVMTTSCAGWGPASFKEALSQIFFSGLFRLIGLFAFNNKAKLISYTRVLREMEEKKKK
jgi:3-dehydrosphinganine reductase